MLALSIAVNHDKFDYIHLISGVDLPIKTQDYIHDFFDRLEPGTNCICFSDEKNTRDSFNANAKYYHLFTNKSRCKNILIRKSCSLMRRLFIRLQKAACAERDWSGLTFGKGGNWASITYDFAKFLVDNKKQILKRFSGVHCSDEIWKHTMLLSSAFKGTAANFTGLSNDARHIDWKKGNPYTWRSEDFDELVGCKELFARKFSSTTDKEIIDRIYEMVKNN